MLLPILLIIILLLAIGRVVQISRRLESEAMKRLAAFSLREINQRYDAKV
jgi:hypothetical protein